MRGCPFLVPALVLSATARLARASSATLDDPRSADLLAAVQQTD
jgi:hypothetical protein